MHYRRGKSHQRGSIRTCILQRSSREIVCPRNTRDMLAVREFPKASVGIAAPRRLSVAALAKACGKVDRDAIAGPTEHVAIAAEAVAEILPADAAVAKAAALASTPRQTAAAVGNPVIGSTATAYLSPARRLMVRVSCSDWLVACVRHIPIAATAASISATAGFSTKTAAG
jgi:hypothetical protein